MEIEEPITKEVVKNSKMLDYNELMTKQPNEIIYILIQKINSQQSEISGLWNRLRKTQNKVK